MGASFLFTRIGAGEFGPVALAGLRVAGAALVGLTNSAIPFLGFSFAALTINAGLSSICNASAPLWGALIARLWLHERPGLWRAVGLGIGFAGVAGLALEKAGLRSGAADAGLALALLAWVLGPVAYGFSANSTRRHLQGVPPMAVAAGSQVAAALVLALPTARLWPATPPAASAWAALAVLAVVCTGLAYRLYFRRIANGGAGNAIAVTFLIPAFAVAWGALFLGETVTAAMFIGCAVILAGTALATGLIAPQAPAGRTRVR